MYAKGSESEGELQNGVYVVIELDENFAKCLCGNIIDDSIEHLTYIIPSAKFTLASFQNNSKLEQCILENFIIVVGLSVYWVIKICEEDDNLSELYGGLTEDTPYFTFVVSIPYYIPENDTSSSTYSLRKTNPIDSLREKIEQMRQQMLDKSAE